MKVNKIVLGFLFALALIGFVDAVFLTVTHYLNVIPPCSIHGCEVVTTSIYSTIAGIPIALFGAVYYLVILALLVAYVDKRKDLFLSIIGFITLLAGLVSLYLIYLQLFVLHAICIYCMTSATTTILLAIISNTVIIKYYLELQKKKI